MHHPKSRIAKRSTWNRDLAAAIDAQRTRSFTRALRAAGATVRRPVSRAAIERALGVSKGVLCARAWKRLVREARRQGLIR